MRWFLLRLVLGREFGSQVYELQRSLRRAGIKPAQAFSAAYLFLRKTCIEMPYKPLTWKLNGAAGAAEEACKKQGGSPLLSQLTFYTIAQLAYEALSHRTAAGKEPDLILAAGEPRAIPNEARSRR